MTKGSKKTIFDQIVEKNGIKKTIYNIIKCKQKQAQAGTVMSKALGLPKILREFKGDPKEYKEHQETFSKFCNVLAEAFVLRLRDEYCSIEDLKSSKEIWDYDENEVDVFTEIKCDERMLLEEVKKIIDFGFYYK